jgi:CTP synthase (UTP-ammonia lyase)
MSEASLKQAFRNLVKAHIAHAASKGSTGNRTNATVSQLTTFKNALNAYVKGTVTHDMRIRYLLNKHYTTNVNKNYLVSLLKNTPANKVAIEKHLREQEGYYFGTTKNSNQKVSIRPPVGAGIRKVKKWTVGAGKYIGKIPGATAVGMRRLFKQNP